ncbi:hypothetical protein L226DRAFT_559224 [Lentinus tigrinus ALCF2SS1-7]|uniref:uncharacterized protein n=1 Tax=Lentinus tigrinus ALCF2SS1-7 TaxID=1328758 RepID=UPI00116606A5|nr:hypothetical protein L226DRAFT_559224 [Lentinus tigrinus ALCF2SS1-7]
MHPFGGTPKCPRCSTPVYAAEQIMGPGRKLYHKYCLKCTSCNKRLDSFSLVEHDEQPYCKLCHVKLFGTRDLRHGNLYQDSPSRPNRAASPPAASSSHASDLAQPLPIRRHMTGSAAIESSRTKTTSPPPPMPSGLLRPNRTLSPSKGMGSGSLALQALDDLIEDFDGVQIVTPVHGNEDTNGSKTVGSPRSNSAAANGNGTRAASPPMRTVPVPLAPSMTGTRYGAALGGPAPAATAPLAPMMTGRQWGPGAGANPKCPTCGKSVYFAEQVKAVGKTWHKWCLRCQGCEKTLDTGRLVDKDGSPFCGTCYTKNFGPAGSGYALLGKAGG